jgi:hypothetical protein
VIAEMANMAESAILGTRSKHPEDAGISKTARDLGMPRKTVADTFRAESLPAPVRAAADPRSQGATRALAIAEASLTTPLAHPLCSSQSRRVAIELRARCWHHDLRLRIRLWRRRFSVAVFVCLHILAPEAQ